MTPEDLPADYYLTNFRHLVTFVRELYDDLLTPDEREYADAFLALSDDAQKLYVRLTSRKGPLFRSDTLAYPEIDSIDRAAGQLTAACYLDDGPEATVHELNALLTRADLLAISDGAVKRSMPRDQLLSAVADLDSVDLRGRLPFDVYRPRKTSLLRVYQLLFFGNLRQDLTEFVLSDLGVVNYERYDITPGVRPFADRASVDRTLVLQDLRERGHTAVAEDDLEAMADVGCRLLTREHEPELERRRSRILNHVARHCERLGEGALALKLYQASSTAPAREREVRVLESAGRLEEALERLDQLCCQPLEEAEWEFAERARGRIEKKLGLSVSANRARIELDAANRLSITVDPEPGVRVEELASRHFSSIGKCAYVENHLLLGLFGLYFWDVVFQPVKGAFYNPYQRGPSDLYTRRFVAARSTRIVLRLEELVSSCAWRDRIRGIYEEKRGLANHFVHWRRLTRGTIDLAIERIPSRHLRVVFERLLLDIRNNKTGLPDLVLFPNEGGYLLLEVKGPGDTLQTNQKRWLRTFEEGAIPYRVVDVSYTGTGE